MIIKQISMALETAVLHLRYFVC